MYAFENNREFAIRHLISFARTYATIFLTIYLTLVAGDAQLPSSVNEIQPDLVLLDWPVITFAAQWGFLAVLRNVWKMLVEKE